MMMSDTTHKGWARVDASSARASSPRSLTLFCVRHAPVHIPGMSPKPIYGSWDLDCAHPTTFATRLESLARTLRSAGRPFDAVVTSDLRRTQQTWRMLRGQGVLARRPAPLVLSDLREQNFGALEGRYLSDYAQDHPQNAADVGNDWVGTKPVDGESFVDVCVRSGRALQAIVRAADALDVSDRASSSGNHQRWLVVAHGGTIRSLLTQTIGIRVERVVHWMLFNLSLTVLRLDCPEDLPSGVPWISESDRRVGHGVGQWTEGFWRLMVWNHVTVDDPSDGVGWLR